MSITVALRHRTSYSFDRPTEVHPHLLRLRPAAHSRTPIRSYSLTVEPGEHFCNWQQDPYGNFVARLVFPEPTEQLVFDVELVAELISINPFDFFVADEAVEFGFPAPVDRFAGLRPFLVTDGEDSPEVLGFVDGLDLDGTRTIDALVEINGRLREVVDYSIRMEPGVQSPTETLRQRIGSCRDSSWLLVQVLRRLGLPARFVSGYLVQLTLDRPLPDGTVGTPHDFTDLHAWAEVYVPGAGWIGLDPTSGLFASEGHIPLAATPDPPAAAPIEGATGVTEVEFDFLNEVTRIHEDPRSTKPYSDEQWEAIDRLGHAVDAALAEQDVRLTMGGEPTFVGRDDPDAPDWDTAADGPSKRARAADLAQRLLAAWGPGGLIHHSTGKWYPGEPLPRWALTLAWRVDGVPLWSDPSLLALPGGPTDTPASAADAEAITRAIAARLAIADDLVVAAYEDPVRTVHAESGVPVDVDPLEYDLDEPAGRASLSRALLAGLDRPAGWVLPLGWDWGRGRFRSSRWELRRDRLLLVPGDSPVGLRLPQGSLRAEEPRAPLIEPDPTAPLAALTVPSATPDVQPQDLRPQDVRPPLDEGEGPLLITALTVEVRDGLVRVFLPPTEDLDHLVQLLTVVEGAAAAIGVPVVLDGYPPPADPRLRRFAVTPDPGVIEVNVPPVASWPDLVRQTTELNDLAWEAGLTTERFDLDGIHTGTGGGNHVTIGGATPGDSPLLRRAHLLPSLLTYWQHHPALSYLFSGRFVGPTSQSPRVDEARTDSIGELEIALAELARLGHDEQLPWLVDRTLRHHLTDVTGNTHRSEFCIDKLWSPDSASGRLGLLELRAFEMPPHARMAAVQALLVRVLVARFWGEPYGPTRLTRWGTGLHDRFLLPHFVAEDLADVVEDCQRAGYPLDASWFDAFMEFRFPRHGTTRIGDIELELRAAVEPWHVLGEELTTIGTARFVDSSTERLQAMVTGTAEGRYVLACNGRRVPLQGTGVPGTEVAGLRYKAWGPPSALHPTIGVHSPLVFDLIDTWTGRSIGGATYHVSHPGGRTFEVRPVNAEEAEGRRIARFADWRHTPGPVPPPAPRGRSRFVPEGSRVGPMDAPPREHDPDQPLTLDLRRPVWT
ncbi:MAG: transglutaminase family protein [Actinomycetota bacterium]